MIAQLFKIIHSLPDFQVIFKQIFQGQYIIYTSYKISMFNLLDETYHQDSCLPGCDTVSLGELFPRFLSYAVTLKQQEPLTWHSVTSQKT
jgi:hypothetical protein